MYSDNEQVFNDVKHKEKAEMKDFGRISLLRSSRQINPSKEMCWLHHLISDDAAME